MVGKNKALFIAVEGIEKLRGFAQESFGAIYVQAFAGTDINNLIQEVKREVDAVVSIPSDVEPPVVDDASFEFPIMAIALSGDVSEKKLTKTARLLRDELALQPHVDVVNLMGVRKEEISIELSENAMRRYNVTFDQVAQAVRKSSINTSLGSIKGGKWHHSINYKKFS